MSTKAGRVITKKKWDKQDREHRAKIEVEKAQPPLPDWMRDPTLLPKKPPGRT